MKVCYFGIYDPGLSRNRIYMKGLRENGVEIIECRDTSWGPLKFMRLFLKHWRIRNSYNTMIVGYPGHVVVPLAKLISRKKVVLDAAATLYEGVILSRKQHGAFSPKTLYLRFVDWMAVISADAVLVESEAQKKYFERTFGTRHANVLYHGADDAVYDLDLIPAAERGEKRQDFTVVFRGKFLPEAGVRHIIAAAKLLEEDRVNFLIIGNGLLEDAIRAQLRELQPANVALIDTHLPNEELRDLMLSAHVSLGQMEDHERLKRTIPFKLFESLALELPYVTTDTMPVREILEDGKSALLVRPADPSDLAEKIRYLKENPAVAERIAREGHAVYKNNFTPRALGERLLTILMIR